MPSIDQGLGLNLVLAGSKASIFTSTFSHHTSDNRHRNKAYDEKNGNILAQNGGLTINGVSKGYLNKGPAREALLGFTNGGLPDLKHRILKLDTRNTDVDANTRKNNSHGPPLMQYTNRQKVLLENDGNNRTVSQKSNPNDGNNRTVSQKSNPSDLNHSKETQNKSLSPSPPERRSKARILLSRPKSSIIHSSRYKENELNPEGVIVPRHASETRLSQEKGEVESSQNSYPSSHWNHAFSASSDVRVPVNNPTTHQWTVSPPREVTLDNITNRSHYRPLAPEPDEDTHTQPPRSPCFNNDVVLSANREYIDQVAKENEAFKDELSQSLNNLLKRAVQSAGPVNEKPLQSQKSQFKEEESSQESSPHNQSPERTPRLGTKGISGYEELVLRRGSVNSQDSGISSESVEKGGKGLPREASPLDTSPLGVSPTDTSPQGASHINSSPVIEKKKSLKSKGKLKPSMLADDPFNILKPRRKKSAKTRKQRKSGKKSRQKSRQDSAGNVAKKKKVPTATLR